MFRCGGHTTNWLLGSIFGMCNLRSCRFACREGVPQCIEDQAEQSRDLRQLIDTLLVGMFLLLHFIIILLMF